MFHANFITSNIIAFLPWLIFSPKGSNGLNCEADHTPLENRRFNGAMMLGNTV